MPLNKVYGAAAMLPYAVFGIPPQNTLQAYTRVGVDLIVDGVNRASDGQARWNINWLTYPMW